MAAWGRKGGEWGLSQVRLLSGLCQSLSCSSGPAGRMLLYSLSRRHHGAVAERFPGLARGPLGLRRRSPDICRAPVCGAFLPPSREVVWPFGLVPWICLLALAGGTVDPCLRHTLGTCPETAQSCQKGYPSSWQRARHWPFVPEVARQGQFCPLLSLGL